MDSSTYTELNQDVAGEPALNESPTFPLRVTHANGFYPLAAAVEIGSDEIEIRYKTASYIDGKGPNRRTVLMWSTVGNLMFTPFTVRLHANGWDQAVTNSVALYDPENNRLYSYQENTEYCMKVSIADVDTITVKISRAADDYAPEYSGTLQVGGLFAGGEPVFHLGFPPLEIINAISANTPYIAANQFTIVDAGTVVV